MNGFIYESGADHRATAERHFRNAEEKMLEYFKGIEKAYTAEVNGWTLELKCYDECTTISLMETCCWNVVYEEDLNMVLIQVEINNQKSELIFSLPILSDEKKIEYIGLRTLK